MFRYVLLVDNKSIKDKDYIPVAYILNIYKCLFPTPF